MEAVRMEAACMEAALGGTAHRQQEIWRSANMEAARRRTGRKESAKAG